MTTNTIVAEISVKKLTIRQLIDEYNVLSDKAVKSFPNRASAEEAVRKERASAGHPGLVVTEKTSIKPDQEMPHNHEKNHNHHEDKHAAEAAEVAAETVAEVSEAKVEQPEEVSVTEAAEAEPVVKTLAEMTDEEVIAAAEKLADKEEISLEDAKLEEAAINLKEGKSRDGKKAKASKAPKVEKQPKTPKFTVKDDGEKGDKILGRVSLRVNYVSDGVEKTEEYSSAMQAFSALGIPLNLRFAFRKQIRESKVIELENDGVKYTFTAFEVPRATVEAKTAEKAASKEAKAAKAAEKAAAKKA